MSRRLGYAAAFALALAGGVWCWRGGLRLMTWHYRSWTVERELSRALTTTSWVGHYEKLGHSLTLAPTRFVEERGGCMGVYARNYGVVQATGPTIKLATQPRPTTLVTRLWRGCHFLVDPEALADPYFLHDFPALANPSREWADFFYMRIEDGSACPSPT